MFVVGVIVVNRLRLASRSNLSNSATPANTSSPGLQSMSTSGVDYAVVKSVDGEDIKLSPEWKKIYDIDRDFDGLTDEEEAKLGTSSTTSDTDSDGLLDRDEIQVYNTNPKNPDTDGDGHKDGVEVRRGYNPIGKGKL